jgi:hypothetical protein
MKLCDIPTDVFNRIVDQLRAEGWKKTDEYNGFDAWMDYGSVVLEKSGVSLRFEWDNWMEGKVDGPDDVLAEISTRFRLSRGAP